MLNLYFQVLGAVALGGIVAGVVKEHRAEPLTRVEAATVAVLTLAVVCALISAPDLGP